MLNLTLSDSGKNLDKKENWLFLHRPKLVQKSAKKSTFLLFLGF